MIYFPNQSRPIFAERLKRSIGFRDDGDGVGLLAEMGSDHAERLAVKDLCQK